MRGESRERKSFTPEIPGRTAEGGRSNEQSPFAIPFNFRIGGRHDDDSRRDFFLRPRRNRRAAGGLALGSHRPRLAEVVGRGRRLGAEQAQRPQGGGQRILPMVREAGGGPPERLRGREVQNALPPRRP